MRIAIAAMDTRGGVQPYLALALGLRAAGHEVRMIAPGNATSMLAAAGIEHAPLSGDVEAEARRLGSAAHGSPLTGMRVAAREMERWTAIHTLEALDACEGRDLVLGGIGGMAVALSAAEKAGVAFMEAHLQPVGVPTDRYQGVLFGSTPHLLGGVGRRLSHRATELGVWMPLRAAMQKARHDVLGLDGRPRAHLGNPVLYGFSRHVVPLPEAGPRERHVTGYWFLPDDPARTLPPGVEAFIAADDRPVVSIGFGSMAGQDDDALTDLVVGAVHDAGARAVLLSGWGGLASGVVDADVHVADALPHDRLFPRMAAVVHHGGAGTTGAGIRAGVPSLVVPFGVDQPFWASRVRALGVGPEAIPRRRLDRAALADGLRSAVGDRAMAERAAGLGALVAAEDGVGQAVAVIERMRHRPG
jgi:UDP:flavonoid glycosyltransferase YjiC (YdhE family)